MTDVTHAARDLVPGRAGRASWRAAAAGLACALAAAGCGAATDTAPDASVTSSQAPAAASAPDFAGGVNFPRTLQADRWVEVQLSGEGIEGWLVTSAALDSPYFDALPAIDRNVRMFDGYVNRVTVPLGPATCPVGGGEPTAVLTLTGPDGATADAVVALPSDVLAGINEAECAVRAVTDAATPALGAPESRVGTAVTTTLTLTRGATLGDATATLTDARGSVIFDLTPAQGGLPLALDPGEASAEVPVTIAATRCDQHAFAESKKTFVFAVWISVDGAEPAYVEIRPGDELKDALQAAFDACGDDSSKDAPGGA